MRDPALAGKLRELEGRIEAAANTIKEWERQAQDEEAVGTTLLYSEIRNLLLDAHSLIDQAATLMLEGDPEDYA